MLVYVRKDALAHVMFQDFESDPVRVPTGPKFRPNLAHAGTTAVYETDEDTTMRFAQLDFGSVLWADTAMHVAKHTLQSMAEYNKQLAEGTKCDNINTA